MKLLTQFIILLFLFSCQGKQVKEPVTVEQNNFPSIDVPEQATEEVLAGSSPVEMAVIVKSAGVTFSEKYLYDLKLIGNNLPPFRTAYALGMLSSDLGYLNTYEKTAAYIDYLAAIYKLSEGINAGQFFKYEDLKKVAVSDTDYENLSSMSVESFYNIDEHLRRNKKNEISIPMLAGVWLEGMYHATSAASVSHDEILSDVIGEQKSTLNHLILLLSTHQGELNSPELITDFKQIKKVFAGVKVSYILSEPQSIEKDGMLTVVQQESSEVEISDETLKSIIETIKYIRNKHIMV